MPEFPWHSGAFAIQNGISAAGRNEKGFVHDALSASLIPSLQRARIECSFMASWQAFDAAGHRQAMGITRLARDLREDDRDRKRPGS